MGTTLACNKSSSFDDVETSAFPIRMEWARNGSWLVYLCADCSKEKLHSGISSSVRALNHNVRRVVRVVRHSDVLLQNSSKPSWAFFKAWKIFYFPARQMMTHGRALFPGWKEVSGWASMSWRRPQPVFVAFALASSCIKSEMKRRELDRTTIETDW